MDGTIVSTSMLSRVDGLQQTVADPQPFGATDAGHGGGAIALLMRDGSRISVELSDAWRQAPELALALAPGGSRAGVVTLELNDGSRLMLPAAEIMGLHLPPERAAPMPSAPRVAEQPAASAGSADILQAGGVRVMRIRDFLPPRVVESLFQYVLRKQPDFQHSKVLSDDPEYRKSVVLFQFPEYEEMFRAALRAAFPPICEALAVPGFALNEIECQLTATYDRGYFKPHTDNGATLGHRRITYVYYLHREPRPFVGGDIRFFDHNPFAVDQNAARNILDVAPVNNSIVFFDSSTYHEVRDVVCQQATFENSRFTINGWLSRAKG